MFTTDDEPQTRREEFQVLLEELLGSDQVHYQPPPDIQMQYPAIVYRHNATDTKFADNLPYRHVDGYQVTVIAYEPDHPVTGKIAKLPTASFQRSFSADHLHHDVYNLFY